MVQNSTKRKNMEILLIGITVGVLLTTFVYASESILEIFNRKVLEITDSKLENLELGVYLDVNSEIGDLLAGIDAELEQYKQEKILEALEKVRADSALKGLENARNDAVGKGKARIDEIIMAKIQEELAKINQEVMDNLSN